MDTEILIQAGLSEIQAKIYLYLIENGQKTPAEIAEDIGENRTTVYSALEKLEKSEIVSKKYKGKISAYIPNHPAALESLAEKRLRQMARQARNLEGNLPSLINFYNEHQSEPGVQTFYGDEGVEIIRHKIIAEKQPFYYIRSRWDEIANKEYLERFKKAQMEAKIPTESITPSEFTPRTRKKATEQLVTRTLLPPGEYDSPVQISIFGDNVTFINYSKGGMSTIIESPEIADAMRQFYLFAKKHIIKSTDQDELEQAIQIRLNQEHPDKPNNNN
ncbi:winged helix-turn-helix transcriptional regulator [Candidatus Saccharibacteria bacterium]|nr:winged helix-turn-helix transcriptional regulator [Candidatus Saccharibacteria bacterium]